LIGKNSFHVVGHDARGAIVLRQKWSRGQVEARLANIPPCLIGMEATASAHIISVDGLRRLVTSHAESCRFFSLVGHTTSTVHPSTGGLTAVLLRFVEPTDRQLREFGH
jgi:hypothetical protein